MGALETNTTLIYGVHIRESANDGSDFTNAAADYRVLFLGEDGLLHVKDSSGTVTSPYSGGNALSRTHVYRATDQNVAGSDTATDGSFSNEIIDDAGCWAIGTPTKLVIPAGLNTRVAIIYGQVQWTASTSGNHRQVWIDKAGTAIAQVRGPDMATAISVVQQVQSKPITLATSDEFKLVFRTDTTGIGALGGEHSFYFGLYTVD